jgi:hypothetical protein
MFVAAFGAVQLGFERAVIPERCGSLCAERGSTFERFRVGRRGACLCADGTEIVSSMPDLAVGIGAVAFLAACYLPFGLWGRRRAAGARGSDR